MDYRLILEK
jgi:hypothetical protein